MALSVRYNASPLGHEISGVDIAGLDDQSFREIDSLYDQYGVVVLRDQHLSPADQVAFSGRFGSLAVFPLTQFNLPGVPEILVVSNVIEDGKPVGMQDAGRYWHTDMWYVANPPRGSHLYALEVPEENGVVYGDTLFASTSAVYDALPADIKQTIDGKQAIFSYRNYLASRRARAAQTVKAGETSQGAREEVSFADISHSLVRVHPRTGRKCLYISEGVISEIVGLPNSDSAALVTYLEQHVQKPEFVYRHNWRVGDLVMWDNCSCLHNAIPDFALPLRRRMHRTTVN